MCIYFCFLNACFWEDMHIRNSHNKANNSETDTDLQLLPSLTKYKFIIEHGWHHQKWPKPVVTEDMS